MALRLAIQTHKRSVSAHRRSLRELSAALTALEEETKRMGIDLVREPTQGPKEDEAHE